jgi:enoyl-CoA hydratase
MDLTAGVATVRLDDPAHRNALSYELSEQLADTIETALAQDARVILLTAAPPVFCAGGSIDNLLNPVVSLAYTYSGFRALASVPVPTIAAVAGAAIGAGVNLPLACDVIIAAESARFDPRFLDVGIHPGGGHLWRLAHRIGPQGAAALSLFGDVLTGAEAAETGLAWRCVPDDALESTAQALAAKAAGRDPALMLRTKQSLRESLTVHDADTAFDLELRAQQWSVEQPHFTETVSRIAASLAKKAARGQGEA